MEENKGVAAQSGPSAECAQISASGLHAASGASTADGLHAASGASTADGLREAEGLRAAGRQSTERRLRAPSGLHAQDGLHAVCKPRAERRLHAANRLHILDGVCVTDAYVPHCDQCKKPILRLETYISVGCVTLCDGCYMNMGTREFLSKIGGELRVME